MSVTTHAFITVSGGPVCRENIVDSLHHNDISLQITDLDDYKLDEVDCRKCLLMWRETYRKYLKSLPKRLR